MVKPLIDLLPDADDSGTGYSAGEWRSLFNPGAAGSATANAFFASYKAMILSEAATAAANGASILCIGTELDQIAGPAYKTYWDGIISAIRSQYPSLKLTYAANWDADASPWAGQNGLAAGTGNLATQISFASELDYIGIDEYAPISNLSNPTLAALVAGWTQAPVDSGATAETYEVTGGQSLISYYESVAAAVGKPLLFTELGYANSSAAASDPALSNDGSTEDDALQTRLYQAFFQAWEQDGNASLQGVYFWNWDPNAGEVGTGRVNFSPQGLPAQTIVNDYFAVGARAETNSAGAAGFDGAATPAVGSAGVAGTGALDGDADANGDALSVVAVAGGTLGKAFNTTYGGLTLNADGSYQYYPNASALVDAPTGAPVADVIDITVGDSGGLTSQTTLTIYDYRNPIAEDESAAAREGQTVAATAGVAGTGALRGDSDPDGVALTATLLVSPGETTNTLAGQYGTLALDSDGAYIYTPDVSEEIAGFAASHGAALDDHFTLLVNGWGNTRSLATLDIEITASPSAPLDFTGDGRSDVLFTSQTGGLATWQVDDLAITGGGDLGAPGADWTYEGAGDFYGDGRSDVLWLNQDDALWLWKMNGTQIVGGGEIGDPGGSWRVVGIGDFYGAGASDILFRDASGDLAVWELQGSSIVASGVIGNPGAGWTFVGVGDFNGDGRSDLLFENADGSYATWTMDGVAISGGATLGDPGADWVYKGVGDFTGDGTSDILFENVDTGDYATWDIRDDAIAGGGDLGAPGVQWTLKAIGDFSGAGRSDLLFENVASGRYATWDVDDTTIDGGGDLGDPGLDYAIAEPAPAARPELPGMIFFEDAAGTIRALDVESGVNAGGPTFGAASGYALLAVGDFNGDLEPDMLFRNASGDYTTWRTNGSTITGGGVIGDPGGTWAYVGLGDFNGDGMSGILFKDASGDYATWDLNGTSIIGGATLGNPGAGWTFAAIGDFNGDGTSDILFENDGSFASWEIGDNAIIGGGTIGSPGGSWSFKGAGDFNGDGKSDLLFEDASGDYATWDISGTSIVGGGTLGNPGSQWRFAGIADLFGDHQDSILFYDSATNSYETWNMDDTAVRSVSNLGSPGAGWTETAFV